MHSVNNQILRLLKSHFPYFQFSAQELESVEKQGGHILHYMNEDEVCGYLILVPKPLDNYPFKLHGNAIYVAYMGTKRKYRGQGIGRNLLKRAKLIAEEEHKPLYTYTATFNIAEINLLFSEGFKAVGKKNSYGNEWLELKYTI